MSKHNPTRKGQVGQSGNPGQFAAKTHTEPRGIGLGRFQPSSVAYRVQQISDATTEACETSDWAIYACPVTDAKVPQVTPVIDMTGFEDENGEIRTPTQAEVNQALDQTRSHFVRHCGAGIGIGEPMAVIDEPEDGVRPLGAVTHNDLHDGRMARIGWEDDCGTQHERSGDLSASNNLEMARFFAENRRDLGENPDVASMGAEGVGKSIRQAQDGCHPTFGPVLDPERDQRLGDAVWQAKYRFRDTHDTE
jgi:hypothetical protein